MNLCLIFINLCNIFVVDKSNKIRNVFVFNDPNTDCRLSNVSLTIPNYGI